jgi:hypothetical protein
MEDGNRVTVVDVDIPFWSMVWIWIKVSIAALPAFLFLMSVAMVFGLMGLACAGLGKLASH